MPPPFRAAARRVVAEVTVAFATLGVGKAVTALYNGVSWLADNLNKLNNLATLLAKIAGQVDAVGTGQAGAGDALAKDITTLLNQSVPLVLSFAAAQVPGLSGLPGAIRDTIQKVQGYPLGKVQQAATTVVGKLKGELAGKGGGGSAPGAIAPPVTLTAGGHTVRLWVATQGSKAVVMRSVDGKDIRPLNLDTDLPAVVSPTPAQADSRAAAVTALTALQTAADTAVGAMAAAGAVKPAAGAKPSPAFAALTAATADLNTKLTTEITALAAAGATCFFGQACFAAGVPLRTPDGSKPVEDFREGDLVLSRDEHDPTGPVEAKRVEAVFRRTAPKWGLRAGQQTIWTTPEHPFYVLGKGWTQVAEMRAGDRLDTEDGLGVTVEFVRDTGEWVPVYNLRVADHHTYFVGSEEWGFSVWAHNTYYPQLYTDQVATTKGDLREVILQAASLRAAREESISGTGKDPYAGNYFVLKVETKTGVTTINDYGTSPASNHSEAKMVSQFRKLGVTKVLAAFSEHVPCGDCSIGPMQQLWAIAGKFKTYWGVNVSVDGVPSREDLQQWWAGTGVYTGP